MTTRCRKWSKRMQIEEARVIRSRRHYEILRASMKEHGSVTPDANEKIQELWAQYNKTVAEIGSCNCDQCVVDRIFSKVEGSD